MNIIICGAGRVGYTIAKLLSDQNHSITVIDQSSDDIQKINEALDVKAIVGKATSPIVLENANSKEADMIIGGFVERYIKEFSKEELKRSTNFLTAKRSFISKENPNLVIFEDGHSFSKDKTNQIEMSFKLLSMNIAENFSSKEKSNQRNINEVQSSSINNIWKISMPLLILITVFLALPLSKVEPRQGRYSKVLPSILVFLVYLGLLLLVKGWLEEGKIAFVSSLLLVHLSFFILGLSLISRYSPIWNK